MKEAGVKRAWEVGEHEARKQRWLVVLKTARYKHTGRCVYGSATRRRDRGEGKMRDRIHTCADIEDTAHRGRGGIYLGKCLGSKARPVHNC